MIKNGGNFILVINIEIFFDTILGYIVSQILCKYLVIEDYKVFHQETSVETIKMKFSAFYAHKFTLISKTIMKSCYEYKTACKILKLGQKKL